MGFRFRRSLTLIPGMKLNLAGKSLSLSVGRKGATQNIGLKGTRTTFGLPGSGLSYSSYTSYKDMNGKPGALMRTFVWVLLLVGVLAALYFLRQG